MLASELPVWLVRVTAFLFGSLWGSFFNVAIYRWPRDMSVVRPPSHCPSCGTPVPPHRNVPIFGYLLMRGRAPCCGARLTPRYLVVEVLGAVLCAAVAERFIVRAPLDRELVPALLETFCWFVFAGGLLIATFTDLEDMQIPDEVSLPGAALGLLSTELRTEPGALDAALGAGMGFLVVQLLFVWGYEHLFGRRGMGEGDAKLLLMIGAFIGYQGVLFTILAASVQGLVAYLVARAAGVTIGGRIDHEPESEDEDDAPVRALPRARRARIPLLRGRDRRVVLRLRRRLIRTPRAGARLRDRARARRPRALRREAAGGSAARAWARDRARG